MDLGQINDRVEKAAESYELSKKTLISALMQRGDYFLQQGRDELAMADFLAARKLHHQTYGEVGRGETEDFFSEVEASQANLDNSQELVLENRENDNQSRSMPESVSSVTGSAKKPEITKGFSGESVQPEQKDQSQKSEPGILSGKPRENNNAILGVTMDSFYDSCTDYGVGSNLKPLNIKVPRTIAPPSQPTEDKALSVKKAVPREKIENISWPEEDLVSPNVPDVEKSKGSPYPQEWKGFGRLYGETLDTIMGFFHNNNGSSDKGDGRNK